MEAGAVDPLARAGRVKSGGYPPTSASLGDRSQKAKNSAIPIITATMPIFAPSVLLILFSLYYNRGLRCRPDFRSRPAAERRRPSVLAGACWPGNSVDK